MSRAAIYARYSSDRQNDRSIEDQVAVCEAFASGSGFDVVERYSDRAISGASTVDRFGLKQLVRDAQRGRFEVVITEAIDRLSRDQADLHGLRKQLAFRGVRIFTVQDGEIGALHAGVKGLLSELYLKDLAQKTHRGVDGAVRAGRHAGGRVYGYRRIDGRKGELEVVPAERDVVVEIFTRYIDGDTPRAIAADLNRRGVPSPRGGAWNASTINGSRIRANGVVCNELYTGRLVWNRQRFVKDPDSGKRVSRPNPRAEWRVVDVPHLRIVKENVWQAAQAVKASKGGAAPHEAMRPRHLFSGLLKCGACGSGYIVRGSDRGRPRLGCSAVVERGTCENRRTIGLRAIEEGILEGLRTQLAAPEVVAEYVREFHRTWNELQAERAGSRRALEQERRRLKAQADRLVDAIANGAPLAQVKERLTAASERIASIDTELANVPAPKVSIVASVADLYRRQLEDLAATLASADDDVRRRTIASLRELVDKVVVMAEPVAGGRVDLEIHGRLAAFLRISAGELDEASVGIVVAGTGFEPVTFRL